MKLGKSISNPNSHSHPHFIHRYMSCDTVIDPSVLVSGLVLTLVPVPIGMYILHKSEAAGKRYVLRRYRSHPGPKPNRTDLNPNLTPTLPLPLILGASDSPLRWASSSSSSRSFNSFSQMRLSGTRSGMFGWQLSSCSLRAAASATGFQGLPGESEYGVG